MICQQGFQFFPDRAHSAIELATPIGPHLREPAESVFSRFTDELSDRATELSQGESHLGKLVSNVVVARK